jgi:polyphosphate kinase 2 (PPK2 family)
MSARRAQRILGVSAPLLVAPGSSVRLSDGFDPAWTDGVAGRQAGKKLLKAAVKTIVDEQQKLAAEAEGSVLLVIQALDAGGKDGTIRHVLSGVNPAGVKVHSFKQPTDEELDHDYLWRYRQRLPGPGDIAVFNRSHYEEVLVVRVHPELLEARGVTPREEIWRERYDEINDWEHELSDRGVRIVKLFLNISNAFSQMLSHTSTEWAPWYVIPADHKWFARLASASALIAALHQIDPHIPQVGAVQRAQLAQARAELEAQAPADEPDEPADPVAEDPDSFR